MTIRTTAAPLCSKRLKRGKPRWLSPPLSAGILRRLAIKRLICRLLHLLVYFVSWLALRFIGRYRILDLQAIRAKYIEIASQPGPLLICANHLTFIDSMIIIWALGSARWYAQHYRLLSWNLPAADVFGRKWYFQSVTRLSKCILIDRTGSILHKDHILRICTYLLEKGEVMTFFPEGGRSRTGRFDPAALTSGIGKVIAAVGPCRVICLYLRGHNQITYADYPPRGAVFRIQMDLLHIDPARFHSFRQVAQTIGSVIQKMEENHFSEDAGGRA